jgi:hypothetical protein
MCHDEPYSANRHDFKRCECGNIAVDGGMDYLRRVGGEDGFEDISISISNKLYQELESEISWAMDTGRNERGFICAIARVLRDNGIHIGELDENKEP